MFVFVKVVELGLFIVVVCQFQMSVFLISQIVVKLEDELQVKLFNCSICSFGLIEVGKIYYQGCCRMLFEVQDVYE